MAGSGRRRLVGVDAARGTALLGMMSVHVWPVRGDDGETTAAHLLAAGRSAALFAVLAGVGIALATGGQRPVRGEARRRWSLALVLRAALIGLVGLLLGALESGVAVILAYYAVLFLVAVPLLGLRPRVLLPAAAVVAVVAPVVIFLLVAELGDPLRENPTIATLLADPGALFQTLAISGYYPVLAWTAYLCTGLAVGRLALGDPRTAAALAAGGAGLALAASATSTALLRAEGYERIAAQTSLRGVPVEEAVAEGRFGTVPTTTWWWLATDAPHSTTPLDLLHTIGTALAVLGVLLLVAGALRGRSAWLLLPLAAAGSMPLTLYSLHVVVLSAVDGSPLWLWLVQAVAALVGATVWRRQVGRGPLEGLLAVVTRRTLAS